MPSLRSLRKRRLEFCGLRSPQDLAVLLEVPRYRLQLLALEPRYRHFGIPKPDGSQRWIEDPEPFLKSVQRQLNLYLQSIYYFHATPAAYGFMISPDGDTAPRNILTHAQQHLGCQWLYNADIEDFFHRIRFSQVLETFRQPPFAFDDALAQLLTGLVCYQDRLPMGAPSSPVVSNFACRQLDEDLLALAGWAGWTYTRFADDMSFSAQAQPQPAQLEQITAVLEGRGLRLNPEKVHLMGPDAPKTVTGLRLEAGAVKLPAGFIKDLHSQIARLHEVRLAQQQMGHRSRWVEEYEAKVEGMLTFAAFVRGDDDPEVHRAEAALAQALDPTPTYAASWLDFGYFS